MIRSDRTSVLPHLLAAPDPENSPYSSFFVSQTRLPSGCATRPPPIHDPEAVAQVEAKAGAAAPPAGLKFGRLSMSAKALG